MSSLQSTSTISQNKCHTRTDSWVEDFVDLSEFCHRAITRIKMEDSRAERIAPPISSTVQERGFIDVDVDESLGNLSGDKWYVTSPLTVQEELSDPITDWFPEPETSSSLITADNFSTREQSSIAELGNDILLNNATTNGLLSITEENMDACINISDQSKMIKHDALLSSTLSSSPPLQPDSTFKIHQSLLPSFNSFKKSPELMNTATTTSDENITNCNASPNTIQSPSISQSHVKIEEPSAEFKIPSPGSLVKRRNVKLDLKFEDSQFTPCSMNTPEVLKLLGDKDVGFDLVSYVSEENKSNTGRKDVIKEIPLESPPQPIIDQKLFEIPIKLEPDDDDDSDDNSSSIDLVGCDIDGDASSDIVNDLECMDDGTSVINGTGAAFKRKSDHLVIGGKEEDKLFSCTDEAKKRLTITDIALLESEKYRELRDRNNEASRRSRANRKTREVELQKQADELERENRSLKLRAEELEQLVKRLRAALMKMVLKNRPSNNS